MNFDPDRELKTFVNRFFNHKGAAVEPGPAGFEALLPDELKDLLDMPEHVRIQWASETTGNADADDQYTIGYGSHILERIINIACSHVPVLDCRLHFDYLKSQGFDRLINEQFIFHGALGKVDNIAEVKTSYIFLTCRYLAQSDEQKEGLVHLVFNLETGAYAPDMAEMITPVAKKFEIDNKTIGWTDQQIKKIMRSISVHAETAVSGKIVDFHQSMTRRFKRDVENLEQYYIGLKKEMEDSLKRPGISEQLMADRQEKISLIPGEFEMKKSDLFKKYSIRVKIHPCAIMRISTPAVKILYNISIGKQNKSTSLIYNPVTKKIDPLVCQGCGQSTESLYFCKKLHMLCPGCSRGCPVC